MRATSKRVLLVVLVTLLSAAALVQAQDTITTPEANSVGQLLLRRPLLGMQLMDSADAPNYYQALTLGGGDLSISLGESCVTGYTGALASLGMVWVNASGAVEIGFSADDPSAQTAVILWDQLKQQWWCNQSFGQDTYLQFDNVDEGIYFVWVMTQTPQTVLGSIFVRAAPAR